MRENVLYVRVRTHHMNTLRYNDIVMCNIVWNPGASPWRRCVVRVPPRDPWAPKHPLVAGGKGFWQTDERIVVGYVLKHRPQVFRPIFQHRRHRRMQKVHASLVKCLDQGVFIARLRQNMARHALLGLAVPVTLIMHIGSFV